MAQDEEGQMSYDPYAKLKTLKQWKEYHEQHASLIRANAFGDGRKYEREQFNAEKERAKLDQVKAVTDLIRASTENLSKAGYLINSLNKEKGW